MVALATRGQTRGVKIGERLLLELRGETVPSLYGDTTALINVTRLFDANEFSL